MYYGIVGDIQFKEDENWKIEAHIENVAVVLVASSEKEAEDQAEMLCDKLGLDYVVPKAWYGRIYNLTDRDIILTDLVTIAPRSKMEVHEFNREDRHETVTD